ncbi:hypothetical protein FGO68_gene5644 [Halteria grandinella]|uniref:Uncharacterized protein n=1 Tax=Halteria grandinella TaxID=5974 RepID=A0A8J8P0P7_HALGN|nr:hypothetical protein FGO68_gene5644 [Halteria grandinella]
MIRTSGITVCCLFRSGDSSRESGGVSMIIELRLLVQLEDFQSVWVGTNLSSLSANLSGKHVNGYRGHILVFSLGKQNVSSPRDSSFLYLSRSFFDAVGYKQFPFLSGFIELNFQQSTCSHASLNKSRRSSQYGFFLWHISQASQLCAIKSYSSIFQRVQQAVDGFQA